jgi:hypothetical protein
LHPGNQDCASRSEDQIAEGLRYALEYYKQLVPNSEATLPGSICNACEPKDIAPASTISRCLWRNSGARSS